MIGIYKASSHQADMPAGPLTNIGSIVWGDGYPSIYESDISERAPIYMMGLIASI